MKLTTGGENIRLVGAGDQYTQVDLTSLQILSHYISQVLGLISGIYFRVANCTKSLLVSDGLDGLSSALVVVFLHVPVHGAQLHLPSKVDIHRTLLHCGVDELI